MAQSVYIPPPPFRPWHFLRESKGNSTPASCLFFDTETVPQVRGDGSGIIDHKFRLWNAISLRFDKGSPIHRKEHGGAMVYSFWKMIDSLLHKRRPLWAFAHNIAFDLTTLGFWNELEEMNLVSTCIRRPEEGKGRRKVAEIWNGLAVLNSPPFIFEAMRERDGAKVVFVDTMNYFRGSVKDIGIDLDSPKLEMPEFTDDSELWHAYCLQDCRIVEKAMVNYIAMLRQHDMGNFRYTASSQAMGFFRHRFNKGKVLIHGNLDAIRLERKAYYGGECRVFQKIEIFDRDYIPEAMTAGEFSLAKNERIGPVYHLDCQSFYPSVMRGNHYPCHLRRIEGGLTPRNLQIILEHGLVVASVTLNSPDRAYPVRVDGNVIMAQGKLITTLCTPELKVALNEGHLCFIGAVNVYDSCDLFTEYVDYCFEQRREAEKKGNQEQAKLWKLFANSLFGKFGQRSYDWQACPSVFAPEPWGNWTNYNAATKLAESYRAIAWQAQKLMKRGEHIDSFPAIAAHVTSYGRVKMAEYRLAAGIYNVYYQDTDSIHCNQDGYDNLRNKGHIIDGEIGKLKLVEVGLTAEYVAPKHYWFNEKATIAGIKRSAEYLGNGKWEQEEWSGIGAICQARPPSEVSVKRILIDRSADSFPGFIDPDGTVHTPYLNHW